MKITRWSPDTCDCIIEYTWDETLDENSRTHILKEIVRECLFHSGTHAEIFDSVLKENRLKNEAVGEFPKHRFDLLPDDVIWKFNEQHKILRLSHPLLTSPGEKTALQAKLRVKFGVGKVEIEVV